MSPETPENDSPRSTTSVANQVGFATKMEALRARKTGMSRYIKKWGFHDPDDILQEVAIAVVTTKKEIVSLEAFITKVLINRCSAAYRKMRKRIDAPHDDPEKDISGCGSYLIDQGAGELDLKIERAILAAKARGLLDKELSSDEATILRGYYLEKKKLKDIAVQLGTNPPHVRQIKRRALKKLEKIMSRVSK